MPRIFISYRRADNSAFTHRLAKDLKNEYGVDNIFIDVDDHNILPGVDFLEPIKDAIDKSDIVLAIVGDKWVDELKERDQAQDVLVMELERAFERKVPIIPITADNAKMPSEDDLWPSIKAFARRNAHNIHSQEKYYDMEFAELLTIIPQVIEYYEDARSKSKHTILKLDAYEAWESTREYNYNQYHHQSTNLLHGISVRMMDTEVVDVSRQTIHINIVHSSDFEFLKHEIRKQWIERTLSDILKIDIKVDYHLATEQSFEIPSAQEIERDSFTGEIILSSEQLHSKWVDAQRLIFQHSHNAGDLIVNLPNLMEYAKAKQIEGNMVILTVSNQLYHEKLSSEIRVKWIEKALSNVLGQPVWVKYELDEPSSQGNPQDLDDIPF